MCWALNGEDNVYVDLRICVGHDFPFYRCHPYGVSLLYYMLCYTDAPTGPLRAGLILMPTFYTCFARCHPYGVLWLRGSITCFTTQLHRCHPYGVSLLYYMLCYTDATPTGLD